MSVAGIPEYAQNKQDTFGKKRYNGKDKQVGWEQFLYKNKCFKQIIF